MDTILFLVVMFGMYKLGSAAARHPDGLVGVGKGVIGFLWK